MSINDIYDNEEKFDENGLPIRKTEEKEVQNHSEEEYDENGLLISKNTFVQEDKNELSDQESTTGESINNNSPYDTQGEGQFGDDGLPIVKNDESTFMPEMTSDEIAVVFGKNNDECESNIKEECNNQHVNIEFSSMKNGKRLLEPINQWELTDDGMGIFIISGAHKKLKECMIELTDQSNNELVWSSPIMKLPEETFVISGHKEGDVYITSRILKDVDLPYGDGVYAATISGDEYDGIFVLSVIDMTTYEEEEEEAEEIDVNKFLQSDNEGQCGASLGWAESEEETYSEFTPEQDAFEEETYEEDTFKQDASQEEVPEEDDYQKESKIGGLIGSVINFINSEAKLVNKEDENEKSIKEETDEREEDCTECEDTEELHEVQCSLDKKAVLFSNLSQYAPLSVEVCNIENEQIIIVKKNIIIEKIGDVYITVLNNFAFRPVYLLDGEQEYTVWNGELDEYIVKISSIISKMYGLTKDEIESMEKLVVVEQHEEVETNLSNVVFSERKDVLKNLQSKYKAVVDLTEKEFKITYNFSDNMYMYAHSKALSLRELNSWSEEAIKVLEPLKDEKILFTGMAALPENYDVLKNHFKTPENLTFVSLARLI